MRFALGAHTAKLTPPNAIHLAHLSAEFFVNPMFVAFAEQEQIGIAERRQERIWIPRAVGGALAVGDDEVVGVDATGARNNAFKEAADVDLFELHAGAVLFVDRLDFNFRGVWNQGADDQPGTIPQRVHAEQGMRRTVFEGDQTLQFRLGQ